MRVTPETPVYRAWTAAADLVLVNVLTLLACIPVLTAGASLVACTRSVMEMVRDEDGSVVRTWWRTFRAELPLSLLWWPPFPILAALGLWERSALLASTEGPAMTSALAALVSFGVLALLAVLLWLLPLIAFFDAPLPHHLMNALRLAAGQLASTVVCLALVLAPLALTVLLPSAAGAIAWFLVILGFAFVAYLIALIQRRTLDALRQGARTVG